MDVKWFLAPHKKEIKLNDYDTSFTGKFKGKEEAQQKLQDDINEMAHLQDVLYASNKYGLLLIFQAMDAAGKDGTIKHVMSGINPQGCEVYSFKAPSQQELDHDYMWRCMKCVPEKGRIGIFNRSYYEEVLVVKVHPELLKYQNLREKDFNNGFWNKRYEDINNLEKYLVNNGIVILKFFLNVSKNEQKKRFLERINKENKNWKFSASDVKERLHWDDYRKAYEKMFSKTSTEYAPWYIIPADKKWFTRAAVSEIIVNTLKNLNLEYPKVSEEHKSELQRIKIELEKE
ncbi:MAG: polyphosphate kinase 2 family protein [Ignavibacteria bacterium]